MFIMFSMKSILLKIWKYLPYKIQVIVSPWFRPLFQVFAAAIILNPQNEVLLVRVTYQRKYPWGLPGGNLEYGEDPEAAVQREVREETGFEIRVKRLLLAKNFGVSDRVGLFYVCEVVSGAFLLNEEISQIGYFSLDHLPDVRPSDTEFLKQLVAMASS